MSRYLIKGIDMAGPEKLQITDLLFELEPLDNSSCSNKNYKENDCSKDSETGRFISTAVAEFLIEDKGCHYIEFNKDLILQVLAQKGCKGLRFYFCDRIQLSDDPKSPPEKIKGESSLIVEPYGIGSHYEDSLSNRCKKEKVFRSNSNTLMRLEVGGVGDDKVGGNENKSTNKGG